MNITKIQQSQFNNNHQSVLKSNNHSQVLSDNQPGELPPSGALSLANFPNVSFKMSPAMTFLIEQATWLKCAYSGKPMLLPSTAKEAYKKLEHRPNAQSAVNYLAQFEKYMHDIEAEIFDIIKDAPRKNKRDFQDILLELKPQALINLKAKQKDVFNKTEKIIDSLSEPIKEQVVKIKDESLQLIESGGFRRKQPLEMLKAIKAKGSDLEKVIKIYQAWYKSPSSHRDADSFIVKYSKEPHSNIAKRLISSSVATIEHIKPQKRNGANDLTNYLLVSQRFNNERNTMPLDEYIMLNDDVDIRGNIQKQLNAIIKDIHSKNSRFGNVAFYPEAVKDTIGAETRNSFIPDTSELRLTKAQRRDIEYPQRIYTKYRRLLK